MLVVFENLKPNQTAATDSPFKTNECTKLFHTPHQKLKNEKDYWHHMNSQVIEFRFDKYRRLLYFVHVQTFNLN